ncbi:MAG: RecX family transcriptional regulator [Bacilli bacterium]|nr:RecX family transcriptional regulator [Bacilli bacterium]
MSAGKGGKEISVVSVEIKKSRIQITLSNKEVIECSPDAYTEFRIYENKVMSPAELKRIKEYVAQDDAYSKAISMISSHPRTEMEVCEKLKSMGTTLEARNKIIARLKKNGLLDDKQFALDYAEELSSYKKEGRNLILRKLKDRGVSEEIMNKLDFPSKTEKNNALSWMDSLNTRYARLPNNRKLQQCKIALRDKGFDPEAIEYAIGKGYEENSERDDRAKLKKDLQAALAKYERKYEGYALRSHLFACLARKGYDYDDINNVLEDI